MTDWDREMEQMFKRAAPIGLDIEIGGYFRGWRPVVWHLAKDESSKGAYGFRWLWLLVRLDYGR